MKIMIAHNYYGEFATGGEAIAFNNEADLLNTNGTEVLKYERSNSEIREKSFFGRVKVLFQLHWSPETLEYSGELMDQFKPDILHVHNYKFLITPSIFQAAKLRNIKTVLTLHNYRLMVPCGNFMTRKGKICERCLNGNPANILLRRCSDGSLFKSYLQYRLFTKTKYELHQLINLVDIYIVLTDFAKKKLIQTGVPKYKIRVKPNFVEYKLPNEHSTRKEERAVFVGRLSYEKGCLQMINNWHSINYPLYIIGSGPLQEKARLIAGSNPNIFFLGNMENEKVQEFLRNSSFLVFPSTWYEGMPLTILEAMAAGIPIIATDFGPRRELVIEGHTGFLYNPSDQNDFVRKTMCLINDRELCQSMSKAARAEYERKYSSEINYRMLSKIYKSILV